MRDRGGDQRRLGRIVQRLEEHAQDGADPESEGRLARAQAEHADEGAAERAR